MNTELKSFIFYIRKQSQEKLRCVPNYLSKSVSWSVGKEVPKVYFSSQWSCISWMELIRKRGYLLADQLQCPPGGLDDLPWVPFLFLNPVSFLPSELCGSAGFRVCTSRVKEVTKVCDRPALFKAMEHPSLIPAALFTCPLSVHASQCQGVVCGFCSPNTPPLRLGRPVAPHLTETV